MTEEKNESSEESVSHEATEAVEQESGPTHGDDDGTVAIEDASDEELSAFIEGELGLELAESEAEAKEPKEASEPDAEQKSGAEKEPEAAPEEETDSKEETQNFSAEYVEQLKQRLAQSEQWSKQRSTEIGQLRKEKRELQNQLKQALSDEHLAPQDVVDLKLQLREAEKEEQQLNAEEAALQSVTRNQAVVHNNVPPEDWNIDAMVRTLQADGISPEYIHSFAENPYASADGLTLIQLAKRAKAEDGLRALAVYTKKLMDENKALKDKPKQVLSNVEKNLKRPASLTSANGGSGSTRGLTADPSQIPALSDADLEALLEGA